jgi:predicted ATPase
VENHSALSGEGVSGAEVTFGPFRLARSRRALLCDGEKIHLGEPAYNVLVVLIDNAGRTVDRDTLTLRAWGTSHLEESNLRAAIAALRRAFNDAGSSRSYIETVARRGYRFSEPVQFGTPAPERRELPVSLSKVIGRDAFVADLIDDIVQYRLVSIVGPGGIGKTTAALAAARIAQTNRHIDSVRLIPLDTTEDPTLLLSGLRAGLGIVSDSRDPMADIVSFLGNRRILIVLDGCERMVSHVAGIIEKILLAAPHVVVLSTTREPLRADGERIRRLEPLTTPPSGVRLDAARALGYTSVELFVDRATASQPNFQLLDENAQLVSAICRCLDGLPLAIELAAARLDAFDLPVLAEVLSGYFRLQMLGRSTALPRHRTLGATLDWSFESLSAQEQIVLRRLGAFRGSFSFQAAREVVAGTDVSVVEVGTVIASLASKSLVSNVGQSPGRHRLLDTTRAYARGKLEESGEASAVGRLHALYYRDMLAIAKARTDLVSTADWDSVYGVELDQIRAAIAWAGSPDGDAELCLSLSIGALPLWNRLGLDDGRMGYEVRTCSPAGAGFMFDSPGPEDTGEQATLVAAARLREIGIERFEVEETFDDLGLNDERIVTQSGSRETLIFEALRAVMSRLERRINEEREKGKIFSFSDATAEYLSVEHRDHPGQGCAVSALVSDVARSSASIRAFFTRRVKKNVDLIVETLGSERPSETRSVAILAYSAWIGAMGLARAVSDESFSREILTTVHALLIALPELFDLDEGDDSGNASRMSVSQYTRIS